MKLHNILKKAQSLLIIRFRSIIRECMFKCICNNPPQKTCSQIAKETTTTHSQPRNLQLLSALCNIIFGWNYLHCIQSLIFGKIHSVHCCLERSKRNIALKLRRRKRFEPQNMRIIIRVRKRSKNIFTNQQFKIP